MSQMIDKSQVWKIRENGTLDVATHNTEPSLTQQQYKDECDINNIMKKYSDTGVFTHVTSKEGIYGDFSEISDYRGMLDTVLYAQNAFATLPAEVRKRFGNDPGNLLEFLQDPKNKDEGIKLGLINGNMPLINDDQNLKPNDDKTAKTPSKKPTQPESKDSTSPKDS